MWLNNFWNKYGFEILIISVVLFFILGFFFNSKKVKKISFDDILKNTIPFNSNNSSNLELYSTKKQNCSKGEIECKRALENIFNKPFYKKRPNFLKNDIS